MIWVLLLFTYFYFHILIFVYSSDVVAFFF